MAELKDANTNPWYVLMTLYGEQVGKRIDLELAEKNRMAWNVWAMQSLSDVDRKEYQEAIGWREANGDAWRRRSHKIRDAHKQVMIERNGEDFDYNRFPSAEDDIDLTQLKFSNRVELSQFAFSKSIDFFESHFIDRLNTKRSYFREAAKFQRCEFHGVVDCTNVTFYGVTEFFQSNF